MSITGEINDPRFWRVSKSGYSIKTGWDINDQRIIATYPGAHLPGPVDGARFTQWLEDAERICELHNATIATAHMAAVLRDWAGRQADRDDRDLLCRAAAMIEALTTPPAEAREPVGVTDAMVEAAADAYQTAAIADGFKRVDDGLRATHERWMRAALIAALAQPRDTPRDSGDAKCVHCGEATMHMGTVCYTCSHPPAMQSPTGEPSNG